MPRDCSGPNESIGVGAFAFWGSRRSVACISTRIDEATVRNYGSYIGALRKFFRKLPIAEISIGHIQTYQEQRAKGQIPGLKRTAGPSVVNHELNTLQQVMVRSGEWARLADWYEPLALPKAKVGCALSEEEESRLLRIAKTRSRWFVAYCCTVLTINTTAGPGEIRQLKLEDIDIPRLTIYIREGAKNNGRIRHIPLNEESLWAIRELMVRATEKGSYLPHHYLLPHRAAKNGQKSDPNKPMGGWRTAWEALRKAADMPHLRMYDLRHHAITKLLEHPEISERTVEALAGHLSARMKDTYSHIRRQALEDAVNRVATKVTGKPKPIMMGSPEVAPEKETECPEKSIPNSPGNSPPQPSATSQGFGASTFSWTGTYPKR